MLVKQLQFKGRVNDYVFCQPLLGEGLEKTAADETRSKLTPEVKKFIEELKPNHQKGIYVLVNALGAGEYYSSNANADFFPEAALSHKGKDYGFETFLDAGAYAHHKNKDKSRAFGDVIISSWNPTMKRVDLVIHLDRDRCKQFGASDVIDRIEAGEYPDVSMGSKVPYDICSICKNKSKTRDDYCEHMKTSPNRILEDGRKVFVYNDYPRFFDISFVFIGADKTAKVMAKLAHKNGVVCLGDYCAVPRLSADVGAMFSTDNSISLEKNASCDCKCGGICKTAQAPEVIRFYQDIVGEEPLEKEAGLKDSVLKAYNRAVRYSQPHLTGKETNLRGLDRLRQKLKGDLAEDLYSQYQSLPAGPEKTEMLRRLVDEDRAVFKGRIGAGLTAAGVGIAGGYGAQKGLEAAVGYGAKKAVNAVGGSKDNKNLEGKEQFQDSLNNLRQKGILGKAVAEVGERTGPQDYTDKLTYQDVIGNPTNAVLSAGMLGLTGKPMLSNLLGAQQFYHGTNKDAVKPILQQGLDPSQGGRIGGAAHRIQETGEAVKDIMGKHDAHIPLQEGMHTLPDETFKAERAKQRNERAAQLHQDLKTRLQGVVPDHQLELDPGLVERYGHNSALSSKLYDLQPRQQLPGIGRSIPVDTTNFVNNARGHTYVGEGLGGRAAATYYAAVSDPNFSKNIANDLQGTLNRFKNDVPEPGGGIKNVGRFFKSFFVAPPKMVHEGMKYYNKYVTPQDSNVVGGVMPHEEFQKRFERDPDDVTRLGTGHRSRQLVEPERLARNEAGVGQIWKNRSKNWFKYVKNNPGKFMTGVGLAGLNAGMAGLTAYNTGKTIKKITPDAVKDKLDAGYQSAKSGISSGAKKVKKKLFDKTAYDQYAVKNASQNKHADIIKEVPATVSDESERLNQIIQQLRTKRKSILLARDSDNINK